MTLRRRDDRGSIPLALLAIITTSGIVVSLGAVLVQQSQQVRFDRGYTQAVQVADEGVQDAVFRANNLLDPAVCTVAAPCASIDPTTGDGYSWYANPVMQGPSLVGYDVFSTGSKEGTDRTIRAQIAKVPRFPLAAFGDQGVELKGSNGADSYNSATGVNQTGNGQIGSNSNVNFNGASTTVDSVVLYNNDAAGNVCNVNGNSRACDNVTVIGPKLDLASSTNMLFIDDQIAACEAAAVGGVLPDWVASDNGGVLNGLGGAPQCFGSIVFDVNTTVANGPAVVFVKQGATFERQRTINCSGCASGSRPIASNLQIFSAGTQDLGNTSNDTEVIAIGNQSYIGAAIYAPRSACLGNPSAAQADVYGALICGSIGRITSGNQGGWAFHYDDALGNIGTGGFSVTRVDELD